MDGFENGPYEDEARERWGHTEAYKESARRTKRYKPEDWAKIKAEGEGVEAAMAALRSGG